MHGEAQAQRHIFNGNVMVEGGARTGAYKGDDGASSSHHEPGRVKFGTAPRDAAEKIFISIEHEKTSGGRCGEHVGQMFASRKSLLPSLPCCAVDMIVPCTQTAHPDEALLALVEQRLAGAERLRYGQPRQAAAAVGPPPGAGLEHGQRRPL